MISRSLADAANVAWIDDTIEGVPRVGVGDDGDVVIEWTDFARVHLTAADENARIEWLAEVPAPQKAKFERGAGKTLPWYLRGALILHASAVAVGDAALILVGNPGAGKSTTAAALCKRGATLLSDDSTVVLDGSVLPIESTTHWLTAEAATKLGWPSDAAEKIGVPAPASPSRVATKCIVLLTPSDGALRVHRRKGIAALKILLDVSLRLPLGNEQSVRDFSAMADLAEHVPVFEVLRSPTFSVTLLDKLVESLLVLLG